MKITVNMRESGQWTFYDVMIASKEGAEPFITVKDCKLVEGSKGPFVSFPARKDAKDKWWPMVYGSDAFQGAVIAEMRKAAPDTRTLSERRPKPPVVDDDIPFN
jgi:DNA-binding cell septation regulator SpoVG